MSVAEARGTTSESNYKLRLEVAKGISVGIKGMREATEMSSLVVRPIPVFGACDDAQVSWMVKRVL